MSKIDTSFWKKFKLSEIFEKIQVEKIKGKAGDFPEKSAGDYVIPLLTAGAENQGFARYARRQDCPTILRNAISVSANGANTGISFYQDKEFAVLQDAYAIKLKDKDIPSHEVGLFLVSCLNKLLHGNFDWSNKAGWNNVKDLEISLPVTTAEVPDWDYMQERIAELEQYLVATGLNDYTLTDEDLKTLSGFQGDKAGNCPAAPGVRKKMREFRMDSIVNILTPKQKYNANAVAIDTDCKSGYPYVVRQSDNNGIRGYIDEAPSTLNPARTFSFGQDTATVFWQTAPYFTGDKIKVLMPKYDLTDEMAQYIMSGIRCAFSNFSWGQQSFSEKVIKAVEVALPIQTDAAGQPVIDQDKAYHPDGFVPDWEYMAAYIRAIEKLVIKNVVDFKDAFIGQAKLAVAGKEAM